MANRPYRGKYPNRIAAVTSEVVPGSPITRRFHLRTNDGRWYAVRLGLTEGPGPKVGQEMLRWPDAKRFEVLR